MAYAAVTCLRSTILRLLNLSGISVVPSTRRTMESLYKELGSLREVLEISGGSNLYALDGKIIRVVHDLEDSLEFHELNQFLSQSHSYGDVELMREISSSPITVKKIKREYKKEVDKSLPEVEAGDFDKDYDDIPLEEEEEEEKVEEQDEVEKDGEEDEEEEGADHDGNDFCWNTAKLPNQFKEIKQCLVQKRTNYVFSIVGMAGIGKTTLAERIFQDPFILKKFECRAFVKVGQNYQLDKLKQAILAQVNPNWDKLLVEKNEGTVDECLKEYLNDKRYLILLDDVWNFDFWDDYFKDRRRDKKAKGSCILLTTRLEDLALTLGDYFYMPFFDNVESWDLLRMKVFADKVCPPELEKVGKKIAEKCDGLPLTIVTVGDILSKAEKTQEYWKEVTLKKSWVFENAYDQILPVLYPSYYSLPPQAKPCFLYMAAFPPNHEVRRSKLVDLWCIEGFLETKDSTDVKSFASDCFDKIVFSHVVVPAANQLSSDCQNYQACSLHSVFRHLCQKELENIEFLHIIQSKEDDSTQGKPSTRRRRVSVYYNVLLSIKDVYTSMESSPTVRSLLCTGAHHKYEVPVNFNLRLLRVCDVSTIRFYKFPLEVLELVQLRYFAITCNQNLPRSISKLWRLEHLIVCRHLCITFTVAESYLPVEVWDLQELTHLETMGRNLPTPPCGVKLEKLVKLLDVGIHTCSEGVLTSIPKLQKLRVKIELAPNSAEPLSYLDHISQLTGLLSFQCVIENPILITMPAAPTFSVSSSSVIKLTLSGLGYPWEYLNNFVKLPHLKVLKLLCYAFQGEKWQVEEKGFLKLECLTIEDTNLVHWEVGEGSFPCLFYLSLKNCYKLRGFSEISSFEHIELVDCNSVAVTCAEQMDCSLTSSWDDTARESRNEISAIYYVDSWIQTIGMEWIKKKI